MKEKSMQGQRLAAVRGLLTLVIALGAMVAFAPGAGAVLIKVGPHNRLVGVLPHRGITSASIPDRIGHNARSTSSGALVADNGTVTYNGGQVLHGATPYLVFWDPNNQITSTQKTLLERYFNDAAADSGKSTNIFGVLRQFSDTTGFADYNQTYSGAQAITDTQPFPRSGQCTERTSGFSETACLFDAQIQSELARLIDQDSLPAGTGGNAPIYFVFTPATVNTCQSDNSTCADNFYCAYHSNYTMAGTNVLYADMPMLLASQAPKDCQADQFTAPQEPNGNITDIVTSSMSHEFSETITDPVNGGGWWDTSSGNEVGDNCAFYGPNDPPNGFSVTAFSPVLGESGGSDTAYDQLINGDPYYTQTEWSNGDLGCEAQPTGTPPTINSISGASSVAAGSSLTLTPSTNPSDPSAYSSSTWDFGDGTSTSVQSGAAPVTHTFEPVHAAFATGPVSPQTGGSGVSFDSSGSFFSTTDDVRLTVVDNFGDLATATHPVTLTGTTVSTLSYSWQFGDGATSTSADPVHPYSSPGQYTVSLTVSAGTFNDTVSHTVTVDAPPTASFVVSTPHPTATHAIAFSAANSGENGGTIISYTWDLGDGTIVTSSNPTLSHVYASAGSPDVQLTVTDQDGHSATTDKTITVGSPPTAAFTDSPSAPTVGESVSFDGSGSQEPGGSIAKYIWSFGDGATDVTSGAHPTHVYGVPGTYSVNLTVLDANGNSAEVSHAVTVSPAPARPASPPPAKGIPTAVISVSPVRPVARVVAHFNGSGSSDSGSTITGYRWTFGDGGSSTNSTPAHTYGRPGTYTVALTVTDASGSTATSSQSVKVLAPGIATIGVGRRGKFVRISIGLSGPGILKLPSRSIQVARPETYVYSLRLSRAQLIVLSKHHAVHGRLVITFVPTVGARVRSTLKFTVKN